MIQLMKTVHGDTVPPQCQIKVAATRDIDCTNLLVRPQQPPPRLLPREVNKMESFVAFIQTMKTMQTLKIVIVACPWQSFCTARRRIMPLPSQVRVMLRPPNFLL
jgi:hypothetical protein